MNNYQISVVLCTHNGEKYIQEQIASILSQTYQPTEIIIQDDCSTDKTLSIIHKFAEKDHRIKVYSLKKHHGINYNFFNALYKASNDYIAFSDQDDIWREDKLAKQIQMFKENNDLWICFHITQPFKSEYPDPNIEYDTRKPNFGLERSLFLGTIPGHTMLLKKDLVLFFKNNISNEIIKKASESFYYDTILGIIANAYHKVDCIVEPLDYHRILKSSASNAGDKIQYTRSIKNMIFQIIRNLNPSRRHEILPFIKKRFSNMEYILYNLNEAPYKNDTLKIIEAFRKSNLRFTIELIRNKDKIFYAKESKTIVGIIRAILFPITMLDYFQINLRMQTSQKTTSYPIEISRNTKFIGHTNAQTSNNNSSNNKI